MAALRWRAPPAAPGAGQPPARKLRPVAAAGADVGNGTAQQKAPRALVELSVAGKRRVELGGGGGGEAAVPQHFASASIDASGSIVAEEGPLAAIRTFFLPRCALRRLPSSRGGRPSCSRHGSSAARHECAACFADPGSQGLAAFGDPRLPAVPAGHRPSAHHWVDEPQPGHVLHDSGERVRSEFSETDLIGSEVGIQGWDVGRCF